MVENKSVEKLITISPTLIQTDQTCDYGCCTIFICRQDKNLSHPFGVEKVCVDEALADESIGAFCNKFDAVKENCRLTNNVCPNVR